MEPHLNLNDMADEPDAASRAKGMKLKVASNSIGSMEIYSSLWEIYE